MNLSMLEVKELSTKEIRETNGGICFSARWCNVWKFMSNVIDHMRSGSSDVESPDPNNPDHARYFS